jgi:hypothetical protein
MGIPTILRIIRKVSSLERVSPNTNSGLELGRASRTVEVEAPVLLIMNQ